MNLSSANAGLARIAACIELETCATRGQFTKVEEEYVSSFALVAQAKVEADKIPTTTKYSQTSKDIFVAQLEDCQTSIKQMAAAHRKFASLAGAGVVGPLLTPCRLALEAAKALN